MMRDARTPIDVPMLLPHADDGSLTVFVRNDSWRMEWHLARRSIVFFGVKGDESHTRLISAISGALRVIWPGRTPRRGEPEAAELLNAIPYCGPSKHAATPCEGS